MNNLRDAYGNKGLGWFESVEHEITKNGLLYLIINHGMHENFSKYYTSKFSKTFAATSKLKIEIKDKLVEAKKFELLLDISLMD